MNSSAVLVSLSTHPQHPICTVSLWTHSMYTHIRTRTHVPWAINDNDNLGEYMPILDRSSAAAEKVRISCDF